VSDFLDRVETLGLDLHSIMIVKNGYAVAEGWWAPYRADAPQLLYSLSKSFTSTAIGIAQSEGLLSIDDPVISFFPDKVKKDLSDYVAQMKVRDLLSMSSGHLEDTWPAISTSGSDFVSRFLEIEPERPPGTTFCYNQGCTYTLSALISRLTGVTLLEYLRPRLLEPMGVTAAEWLTSREGITQGFSGLHLETESIAKFGVLQLQLGEWKGDQIAPADYLVTAHEKQVANLDTSPDPDWQQGYGFQFWVCRHGAYRGDGAYGQLCVAIPQQNAVVVCTAGTPEMQMELDAIWEHLLPALSDPFEPDRLADETLFQRLDHLAVPRPETNARVGPVSAVFDRAGRSVPLTEHIMQLRVERSGSAISLGIVTTDNDYDFNLTDNDWTTGAFPGRHTPFPEVAVCGGWISPDRFSVDVVWPASPHRLLLRGVIGTRSTFKAQWATPPLRGLDS
jgi:CubicO group peptidase (beta-lactamase class C family)